MNKYLAILGACGAMGIAATANAAPVTIDNAGFENPALNPGGGSGDGFQFSSTIPDWFEESGEPTDDAIQDEAANANIPATPYGDNWLNLKDAGSIYQEIGTYAEGQTYTIDALFGDRSNKLFDPVVFELWAGNGTGADGTLLSSFASIIDSDSVDPFGGLDTGGPQTATGQAVLTTGTTGTAGPVGASLWLRISVDDQLGSTNDAQSLIDNIEVDVVPEPASLSLLALGGLAAMRRRRA